MTLLFIVGATATGKSDLAVRIASEIGAEIVNADSMQLYRGMDIGTAKLNIEERRGIKHHLIDILDVNQDASVAQYQQWSREVIDQLLLNATPVVVVGGTGLYVKSILDDLNFPDTDPVIRAKLSLQAEEIGAAAMHERLSKLDPAAAVAIPKENVRRVVRALEVIEITGKPFTASLPRVGSTRYPSAQQFGLVMDRDSLKARIDRRVDQMWQLGLVDEVRTLISRGLLEGRTAKAALGYSQVIALLEDRCTQAEAMEETKRATRQYARRQETWFSRDERIKWLKGDINERADVILSSIVR